MSTAFSPVAIVWLIAFFLLLSDGISLLGLLEASVVYCALFRLSVSFPVSFSYVFLL
jgi:hypothetical protein